MIKAGGGQLAPASRWQAAAAGGSRSGGAPLDLVISDSASASSSPALAALVGQGALAAGPKYIVEWLARPRASLSAHVLLRRCGGAGRWGRAQGCQRGGCQECAECQGYAALWC